MNKVTYLTYQSFPNQKANSIQTIRMLENLTANNVKVRLFYPSRDKNYQKEESLVSFYNILHNFEIFELPHKLPFNYFNYFQKITFVFSSFVWSLNAVRKVMKNTASEEVMMTRTHWVLLFLSKYKNLIIFECHKYSKINNFIFKILKTKKNVIIIFTNEILKNTFKLSKGLKDHSIILPSSYEERFFKSIDISSNKKNNRVVFVGHLLRFNKSRDIEFLIKAFSDNDLKDYELRIIGGPKEIEEKLKKNLSENIKILGHLSNKDAIKEMESAEIGILLNEKNQHSELHTSPIKYFEYIRANLKVLAIDFDSHHQLPITENIYFFEKNNIESFKKNLFFVSKKEFRFNPKILEYSYGQRVIKLINHIARLEGLEPPTL